MSQAVIRSFWTLGLASGILGRRLAEDLGYANPDEAYLAALVHLIGSALLAVEFTPRFEQAIETGTFEQSAEVVSIA